jgi:hypothetical protein
MTYEEATQAKAEIDEAVKLYRADPRFRVMAQSTVSLVMGDHGPVDPEQANREASEIALTVAVTMLARIYWRDAEIGRLKAERDAYKRAAETSLLISPTPFLVQAALTTSSVNEKRTPQGVDDASAICANP